MTISDECTAAKQAETKGQTNYNKAESAYTQAKASYVSGIKAQAATEAAFQVVKELAVQAGLIEKAKEAIAVKVDNMVATDKEFVSYDRALSSAAAAGDGASTAAEFTEIMSKSLESEMAAQSATSDAELAGAKVVAAVAENKANIASKLVVRAAEVVVAHKLTSDNAEKLRDKIKQDLDEVTATRIKCCGS